MTSSDCLIETLADQGWVTSDAFVNAECLSGLYQECTQAWTAGVFRQAGIGRRATHMQDTAIRGDTIYWLEPAAAGRAGRQFLTWAADLQQQLNRQLYTGLNSAEFHFARYPAGQGYKRHMDQHQGQSQRRLSLVLYLNPNWTAADHGELCLYAPQEENTEIVRVLPQFGRLVLFRSDVFPHEVLPATQTRWSLTGWFRTDGE